MQLSNPLRYLAAAATLMLCLGQGASAEKDIVDTAVEAGSFKTLAAALQAADLVEALKGEGPFTVFAPTDEAFAKLPEGTVQSLVQPANKKQLQSILTYHVAKGAVPASKVVKLNGAKTLNGQRVDIEVKEGKVMVDDAQVVTTDIKCSNGIIHVINKVIMPATEPIPTVAEKAGNFSTLLAAVQAAGLAETLSGEGPFTVFAPTDEAFSKIPSETLQSLLKPENKSKLVDILKYHVVSGRVYSEDALEAGAAKTLQGGSIKVSTSGDAAKINDAKLLKTDIDASNGVIHVIDAVIMPTDAASKAAASEHPAVSPRKMIELAVAEGSQLFNAGHASACANLYNQTAHELMELEQAMPAEATSALVHAVEQAKHCGCSNSRAWALRKGLDTAHQQLAHADMEKMKPIEAVQ